MAGDSEKGEDNDMARLTKKRMWECKNIITELRFQGMMVRYRLVQFCFINLCVYVYRRLKVPVQEYCRLIVFKSKQRLYTLPFGAKKCQMQGVCWPLPARKELGFCANKFSCNPLRSVYGGLP